MSFSSVTETAEDEKEIAATINSVVKALKFSSPDPVRRWAVRLPANGINTNRSAASTGAAAVTQIFDHNRDPI